MSDYSKTDTDFMLHGHAATVASQLADDLASGKLAHGILLSGPKGIGKATLAYWLARRLLAADEAARARIDARSHADLLVVEPLFDTKKEEYAREITAEQTRGISEFLALTAGEGAWRVVIVDGADSMNVTAANAILKILEEPPKNTVLILVSHHASRLLPTILSRCRTFKIAPLSPDDFSQILRQHMPDLSREQVAKLGELSDFSPGIAAQLHEEEAIDLLDQLELIFAELPTIAHERVLTMAERIASGSQHKNWQLFTRLVLFLLAREAKRGSNPFWAQKWQETSEQFALCEARHLDYKSVIISFFHSLPHSQPFSLSA